MTTATQAPTSEVRVFKPSDGLMKLSDQIRTVAGFDPGLVPVFRRATQVAAVKQLMSHPEMAAILDALEGSKAGFLTDLSNKGLKYEAKIRDSALTSALSQGAQLAGGEITILAGNAFLNKPYYQRMLDELGKPGSYTEACKYEMLWWDPECGDVVQNGNLAIVPITIRYRLREKEKQKELDEKVFSRKFFIRTYPSDGPDKWVGQAERRAFQRLLRYLSGIDFGEEEEGSASAPATPPPVGTMNTGKDKPPAPSAADDASFKEIVNKPKPTAEAAPAPQGEVKAHTEKRGAAGTEVRVVEPTLPAQPTPPAASQPAALAAAPKKPELF